MPDGVGRASVWFWRDATWHAAWKGAWAEVAVNGTFVLTMESETAGQAIRPLRRNEYEELVALGRFDGERVELVRGRLVTMSPQGSRHLAVVARVGLALQTRVPPRYRVLQHSPLALGDVSMPEPDVSVTPIVPDHEFPRDPILLVEVADSSLAYDQRDKLRLYAAAGVPTYWLVDLVHDEVRVHTRPVGAGDDATYRTVITLGQSDVLRLDALPALSIPVDELIRPSSGTGGR